MELWSFKLGSRVDGRLDSRLNLLVGIFLGHLCHSLEHGCWWSGSHELEDGSGTDFRFFSGVLVDLEEDVASDLSVGESKLAQSSDHLEALEVSAVLGSFKVRLESAKDSLVSNVSKALDVERDHGGVILRDGFMERLFKMWDKFVLQELLSLLVVKSSKDVNWELSLLGSGVNVDSASKAGELEVSGFVNWLAFSDSWVFQKGVSGAHVLVGWDDGVVEEGGQSSSSGDSGHLLVFDEFLDGQQSWASSAFGNSVADNLTTNYTFSFYSQ